MKFNIKVWHKYRRKAATVSKYIASFKDKEGNINLEKKTLDSHIQQITDILKECSDYMDKCQMKHSRPLWKYVESRQATHPSNETFEFIYKMSKEDIYNYGSGFMKESFKEAREG